METTKRNNITIEELGLINIYPKSYNEKEFGINVFESLKSLKEI